MEREICSDFRVAYSLTEAASVVSMTLPEDPPEKRHYTVGRPLPGIEVRILDNEGSPSRWRAWERSPCGGRVSCGGTTGSRRRPAGGSGGRVPPHRRPGDAGRRGVSAFGREAQGGYHS